MAARYATASEGQVTAARRKPGFGAYCAGCLKRIISEPGNGGARRAYYRMIVAAFTL